jgi:hypothetical protein
LGVVAGKFLQLRWIDEKEKEEAEAEAQRKAAAEREQAAQILGMLKSSQIEEDRSCD